MKIINLTIGMACLLGACHSNRMEIKGETGNLKENKIYLGKVTSEYYGTFDVIDSAEVKEGKFYFTLDSVKPEMLFLGFRWGKGGMLFAEAGNFYVSPSAVKKGKITWEVPGSALNQKYREYLKKNDEVRNQKVLDSLNDLFFKAREKNDREEMARIKEQSSTLWEQADKAEKQLSQEIVAQNKNNAFGMYLYYSKLFIRKDFPELKDVEAEREYLAGFGAEALQSPYKQKMEDKLDLYAGCAIGAVAPEISGVDTLGNPLKLSDFRGKYVIVDFWNSYCHWCREETPWLRKALETFEDKDFTILGVSNDLKKELWLKAIHEDKSYWDHLLVPMKDPVMDTYCIKGIPHIILVGPDGKILAKEMRHEELTEVPAKFINL